MYDSRGSPYDKLKDKVIFSYSVNKDDDIFIKKGNIVDVITMETDGSWHNIVYGI